MPRRGMLIMTDGTPHDWFGNGIKFSLHMTLDDATGEILSGWFTPTETQLGFCYAFKIMCIKHGIPQVIYGDRTSILWNQKDGELTQVGRMLEELGIELIYANSSEAKGKIEKMNFTIQNRLLNDIKRFNIKTYEELNKWFNDFYIDYINKKFSYKPKEEETEFIPLGNTDLTKIMCIKEERIILNGNMCRLLKGYVSKIIVSFIDDYKNVRKNERILNFKEFTENDYKLIGENFSKIASKSNMTVQTCFEDRTLTEYSFIQRECLSHTLAYMLTGKTYKKWAARKERKCNCVQMVDIGVYNSCRHFCKYCYANFNENKVCDNFNNHIKSSSLLIGTLKNTDTIKIRK